MTQESEASPRSSFLWWMSVLGVVIGSWRFGDGAVLWWRANQLQVEGVFDIAARWYGRSRAEELLWQGATVVGVSLCLGMLSSRKR